MINLCVLFMYLCGLFKTVTNKMILSSPIHFCLHIFLRYWTGEKWPVVSMSAEDQVHLIINLHTPVTSAAPTHKAATCVSHCGRIRWPLFSPRPASNGLCGVPQLIYEPNGLVPTDSDASQSGMHDFRLAQMLKAWLMDGYLIKPVYSRMQTF